MIKSMTGYGRGDNPGKYSWVVEIRTVNHRFMEVFVRLPKPWLFLEDKVKSYIKGKITRGRVDVFLNLSSENFSTNLKIDKALVDNYYKSLVELQNDIGFEGPISLSLLSQLPEIFKLEEETPIEQELWDSLEPALKEAVDNLIKMRLKEGENLWKDLVMRLDIIKRKVDLIKVRTETVLQEYREKLRQRVDKLCCDISVDQERVETEVVLFAEKSNITEEIVRLSSHISYMRELLDSNETVGKKADFVAQEMFREANTIAAKSSDYDISREVIEVKSELEKIREQVQNIE